MTGCVGGGRFRFAEHLPQIDLDGGRDRGQRNVVDGVIERIFEVASDLIQRQEDESHQRRSSGVNHPRLETMVSGRRKQNICALICGRNIVLPGHRCVFDALGSALGIDKIVEALVHRMPLCKIDPADVETIPQQL